MQRSDLKTLQITQQLLVLLDPEAQFRGHFGLSWRSSKTCCQDTNCLFNGPALAPKLPRTPIEGAKAVENRSANSKLGIAAKLDFLGRVELDEGVHQTNNSSGDQVLDVHMLRQSLVDPPCNETDDGQMLEQEPFLFTVEAL